MVILAVFHNIKYYFLKELIVKSPLARILGWYIFLMTQTLEGSHYRRISCCKPLSNFLLQSLQKT